MRENYEATKAFIYAHEGFKITDIAGDRGGLTAIYGLTLAKMKELNIDLDHDGDVDAADVKLVTPEVVDRVFRKYFWDRIGADLLPGGIDLVACDIAWNSGPGKVKQFVAEGYGGPYERLLLRRLKFYRYQRDRVPGQAKFYEGWVNRAFDALDAADRCFKGGISTG